MMESSMRLTEALTMLPGEYWETESTIYGALVDNVSADGLLILSIRGIPVGSELNVRIFYANEYELDGIKAVANIVQKEPHIAEGWKGYKYGLEVVQISEEDRQKLNHLLNGDLKCEEISGREDIALGKPSIEKDSSPPLPDSDLTTGLTATCESYENGKCLKTSGFCDLCHNEDETILEQRASRTRKR